ncbi:putative 2Fe-2S ferredoxin-type iron-sulfur binding domain, Beta-grasp domain superfamily [Dioscorea sansibarensis]
MEIMGALQLHPPLPPFKHNTIKSYKLSSKLSMSRGFHKLNALETNTTSDTTDLQEEPPSIDFAFVSPKLLPDGSPDVHIRSAVGGQKLRDIMQDGNIDLYGPYDIPLANCAGGGTCGTCLVEVVEGKELLSPRTDKEKEILKRKPKTWRLACQTVVGKPDSRGELIIQQLPEWKAHEWE